MRVVTGDEAETQEEEKENGEIDDFGSQVSLNSSTHENEASTNIENSQTLRKHWLFGSVWCDRNRKQNC